MSSNFLKNTPLPSYEQLINCMHCGMCLPTCPTYELTKREIYSPRGRIHMIRAIADGAMEMSDNFQESISFCLNCQACVSACPAGVEYGQLVESVKLQIASENKQKSRRQPIGEKALNWLFVDLKHLRFVARLLRLYQRVGLEKLMQYCGILKMFSKRLHEISYMAPVIPKSKRYMVPQEFSNDKQKKIRVGVLVGCVQDIFFRDINQDTIDVLLVNGYDVFLPEENICCGSVHGHNGDLKTAKQLAKRLMDSYESANVEYIIVNSAGCGAYMKEYKTLFSDDREYSLKAIEFSNKVKDISEFLVDNGWTIPQKVNNFCVTYHEPCHLIHAQKISEQPREIITSIPGIQFVELPEADWCCGSAGIYNIVRYDDAIKILERKIKNIKSTGTDWVITGNPGCMIQLIYGAKKFNGNFKILHPVSLLNMAYKNAQEDDR